MERLKQPSFNRISFELQFPKPPETPANDTIWVGSVSVVSSPQFEHRARHCGALSRPPPKTMLASLTLRNESVDHPSIQKQSDSPRGNHTPSRSKIIRENFSSISVLGARLTSENHQPYETIKGIDSCGSCSARGAIEATEVPRLPPIAPSGFQGCGDRDDRYAKN